MVQVAIAVMVMVWLAAPELLSGKFISSEGRPGSDKASHADRKTIASFYAFKRSSLLCYEIEMEENWTVYK